MFVKFRKDKNCWQETFDMDSSTSRSDKSENVFFFVFLSMFIFFDIWDCISDILLTFISCVTVTSMLSYYLSCRCYFYIKRIHHVKALYVLTNEKHFPKTLSQLEFVMACLQKYRIVVNSFFGEFIQTQKRYPTSTDKIGILT